MSAQNLDNPIALDYLRSLPPERKTNGLCRWRDRKRLRALEGVAKLAALTKAASWKQGISSAYLSRAPSRAGK